MENKNKGHRQRLRDRFVREGLDGFQDHEVLELLLFQMLPYKDTNKIAHDLLSSFGSVANVLNAPIAQLTAVDGISEVTAVNLSVVREVWFRYQASAAENRQFTTVSDVAEYAKSVLTCGAYERLLVAFFDTAAKFVGKKMYCSQSDRNVDVPIRRIVSDAMSFSAAGVMLFHGHVKGTTEPSKEDVEYTEKLYMTLCGMNVTLIDHAVFNNSGDYYSFRQHGYMAKFATKYNKDTVK